MSKRAREITAVVLLVVLLFGAASVAGWYFNQSRHWNVAATNLDDTLGGMEDYTIIAYKGTLAVTSGSSSENPLPANWDAFLDDQNRGDTSKPFWMRLFESGEEVPPTLVEVIKSYKEKGANVVTLHVDEPDRYTVPICTKAGNKWVGIVSFTRIDNIRRVSMVTRKLEAMHPDYTIALVDDVKEVERVLDRYDIVLCTTDAAISATGLTRGSTLVAQVPTVDFVGTVSIAPSNVASVKTVVSL